MDGPRYTVMVKFISHWMVYTCPETGEQEFSRTKAKVLAKQLQDGESGPRRVQVVQDTIPILETACTSKP